MPRICRHTIFILLEKFADTLSCIDQCFIADEMLEHLPVASQVGKTIVGGIDLNKARMRHVVDALIALSPLPNGFTASNVADRVRALSKQSLSEYGPRHAAYDLKKLRGKQIVRRIGHTRRYEPLRPTRAALNPKPIDTYYQAIRAGMKGLFHELGIAA